MGPTWGPPGSCRPQVGPMEAPWTLLSGILHDYITDNNAYDFILRWIVLDTISDYCYLFTLISLRSIRTCEWLWNSHIFWMYVTKYRPPSYISPVVLKAMAGVIQKECHSISTQHTTNESVRPAYLQRAGNLYSCCPPCKNIFHKTKIMSPLMIFKTNYLNTKRLNIEYISCHCSMGFINWGQMTGIRVTIQGHHRSR